MRETSDKGSHLEREVPEFKVEVPECYVWWKEDKDDRDRTEAPRRVATGCYCRWSKRRRSIWPKISYYRMRLFAPPGHHYAGAEKELLLLEDLSLGAWPDPPACLWTTTLTPKWVNLLEYVTNDISGISRPAKYWGESRWHCTVISKSYPSRCVNSSTWRHDRT